MVTDKHVWFVLLLGISAACAAINLSNYKLTWDQDFTKMQTLSVSPNGPINTAKGPLWVAHKPGGGDWANFIDPKGPYLPFNVGNGQLTIRAEKINNTYIAGFLSSMDEHGNGFAQKYGYFECMAKLPTGLGTWPAFWLLDSESLVNKSKDAHEIDIMEQYGDGPALLRMTLHFWPNTKQFKTWGSGGVAIEPSMETGFHTYGFDYQPDYLTFYYDREIVYQAPNFIPVPGLAENKYTRPMFVMVNLAYGGGGPSNDKSALDHGGPRDMLIQYVKVWQGSGGSSLASSNTNGANALAFNVGFQLISGQGVSIKGVSLNVTDHGNLVVYNTAKNNAILWQANIEADCGFNPASCRFTFQGDGNWVGYDVNGNPYWGTSTYKKNATAVLLSNSSPFVSIVDQNGAKVWP